MFDRSCFASFNSHFRLLITCEVSSCSFVEASPEAVSAICTSSKVFFKATGAFCSLLGCFSSSWLHLSVSCGSAAEGSSGEGLTLVLAGYGRPLKLVPKSGSRRYVLKRAIVQVRRHEWMQQHSLSLTGCCPYD